jgi:hypothetical protein
MIGMGEAPLVPVIGGDLRRARAMVAAVRELHDHVRAGRVPAEDAGRLVTGLMDAAGALEASIHVLSAQRSAVVALAAAVVGSAPHTMVPMRPGEPPTTTDRDHAHRAFVADLATTTGASEATTATLVETSTVLAERLPGVLAAMAAGELGDRHARHVVRHAEGLPAEALPRYEATVLDRLGRDRTPAGVGRAARMAREQVHPRSATGRHARASLDRSVRVEPAADGMAWLTAFLPAVHAHAIADKLTGVARAMREDPEEQRTLAQRRADALTALVLDSGDDDRPDRAGLDPVLRNLRPTVAVTVPVLSLLGLSEEPADLEGHGPIDAGTARELAAHAPSFIRILTHPETGTVLSVGRDRYTVPADLKTWVRLRDGTCRFPGCHRPASRSEVDHTVPFRENGATGETAASNLAHLCPSHHRLKHTTRWSVTHGPDASLTWTSPTGATHTTRPELDTAHAHRTTSSPGAPSGRTAGRQGAPTGRADRPPPQPEPPPPATKHADDDTSALVA